MGLIDRVMQVFRPPEPLPESAPKRKREKRSTDRAVTRAAIWGEDDRETLSGEVVTEDKAMTYAAFYGAVSRISEDVAKLQVQVFRQSGSRRTEIKDHQAYYLLHVRPNAYMTPYVFKQTLMSYVLRWGNAYAEIEFSGDGKAVALHPLASEHMTVKLDGQQLAYLYRDPTTHVETPLGPRKVLHIRALGNGFVGMSPVAYHKEAIGMGLAAEKAGSAFFGSGFRPGAVLSVPGVLKDEAFARLRKQMQDQAGGKKNTGKLLITEQGGKLDQWTIPPTEAQYLESRVFQVQEICRIFHLPPHKLQELTRATFSNVEELDREYFGDCLQPWLTNFEEECEFKLVSPSDWDRIDIAFNAEGLLRGSTEARTKYYQGMFGIGAMSINDIRVKESMEPVEGGDKHYVAVNLAAIEDPKPVAPPAKPGLPDAAETPAHDEDDGEDDKKGK